MKAGFSIVVPTYNEENDIARTLDSLINLNYHDYEIIVVDDSNDRTPEIVNKYKNKGVILVREENKDGRCGARNIGIRMANYEIVVVLNADVLLDREFLNNLLPHYEKGADYVLVKSKVKNMEDLFARYIECTGKLYFSDPEYIEWTEGFSCRKEVAINAGLFPVGYSVPICAGEDGCFGSRLKKMGATKVVDFNIVVEHVSPASLKEYWHIRMGRGKGTPQIRHFIDKWSLEKVSLFALARIFQSTLGLATLLPLIYKVTLVAHQSNKKTYQELLPFTLAYFLERLAFHFGEIKSIVELYNAEKK